MVDFDGVESRYINVDRMGRTVQLVPAMARDIISYGDLLIALEDKDGRNRWNLQG